MGPTFDICPGGDNNLIVIVSSDHPNIRCNEAPSPPWRSTINIIAEMTATKDMLVFGKRGQKDVEVQLPFTIRTCKLTDRVLKIDETLTVMPLKLTIERY